MPKPLYQQIADALREAIAGEKTIAGMSMAVDCQIPTERELMSAFDTSRNSVRGAVRILVAEGLLETRGRSGTYVRRRKRLPFASDYDTTPAFRRFQAAAEGGEATEDFSFKIEPASAVVAERLGVEVDELVAVRTTTRLLDDVPWGTQVFRFPLPIAEKSGLTVPRNLPEGSLHALTRAGYAETGAVTNIWTRPATHAELEAFGLPSGMWMLIHERVGYADRTPVRYSVEHLPADRHLIVQHHGEVPEERR